MPNKGINQKHLKKKRSLVDESRFREHESCSLNHQRYSAQ